MRRFVDEAGNEVRLTDERLRHILRRHPEMARQLPRFGETLAEPDTITTSSSGPDVRLYYRLYPDPRGRRRYICLVVKRMPDYSFVITGYPARNIRRARP